MREFPPILNEIADAVGDTAALKLWQEYGGTMLYVPVKHSKNTRLNDTLTSEQLQNLIHAFSGSNLDIPTMASLKSKKKAILSSNAPASYIARKIGCHRTYVHKVRLECGIDEHVDQHSLFDTGMCKK